MKHNYLKHLFTVLLLLCSTAASAHDFKIDGIYYRIVHTIQSSGKVSITAEVTHEGVVPGSLYEYSGDVVIPSSVSYEGKEYSVASIGSQAFYLCRNLTSITIPNSVKSIGESAFQGCRGLTNVTIPSSVTSIKSYAFEGCSGLTSVTIPNSVKSIGQSAFEGCRGLTNITIPNSITDILDYTFFGCSGLTSVTIPNSITCIRRNAFYGCSGLTSVIIGNSVTDIHDAVFYECSNLKTVINLSNLTIYEGSKKNGYVGYYADKIINAPNGSIEGEFIFGEVDDDNALCGYLGNATQLILPENYKGGNYVIGNSVFKDYRNFTSVTIPNSVTGIGQSAFSGCSSLTSVTIPSSVTSIGDKAFLGCSGFTRITIPNSVAYIGESAFYDCSNLKTVINLSDLTISKGSTSNGHVGYYADKVINVSNGSIEGDFIFGEVDDDKALCGYLGNATQLILPENYKGGNYVIGEEAFSGCSGLTRITIPNSVAYIGESAFYNCSGLTNVTIPNSVVYIGESAFYGCSNLKTVINLSYLTISKGSTSNGHVGYYADKVINIPDGSIEGDFVFGEVDDDNALCGYLGNTTQLSLPENYKGGNYVIGEEAFSGCSGLTNVTIPNSVTYIGKSAFSGCSGLTNVTIPNSVTYIGESAFSGCSGLTNVTIPNSVKTIAGYAFYGCSNLKTVINLSRLTISKGSTSNGYVGYYADKVINAPSGSIEGEFVFRKINGDNTLCCYIGNATQLSLPENYKGGNYVIGEEAFYGCSSLTSVTIPNSVKIIADYAFSGCSGLTSVTIPNGVTSIGGGAFAGCSGLTSVTIGNSVTSIGIYAFEDCSSLKNVTIGNSVASLGLYAFKGCSGLTSVYSNIPGDKLFALSSSVFSSADKDNCTLFVPIGSKKKYSSKAAWNEFKNIVEFDFTGIEDVETDAVTIEITAGGILLTAADGKMVAVYSTSGALVEKIDNYASKIIMLDKGMYIVRVGDKTVKVKL